jgi:hypothetical protein
MRRKVENKLIIKPKAIKIDLTLFGAADVRTRFLTGDAYQTRRQANNKKKINIQKQITEATHTDAETSEDGSSLEPSALPSWSSSSAGYSERRIDSCKHIQDNEQVTTPRL